MLFSALNPQSGPSIYYVYGVRNVGKTVTLKYLASKGKNVAYLDALNEETDFKRIVKALEKHDVVIVDEITHVSLSKLRDLPALLERLAMILRGLFEKKGVRKKIIFTASYNAEHYAILERLVRIYAKYLEVPKSARGSEQPYRIHALPRTFLQAAAYRADLRGMARYSLTRRSLTYALIRYAIPERVRVYHQLVTPSMIERRLRYVPDEYVEKYFLTGGFPSLIVEGKRAEISARSLEEYVYSLERLAHHYDYVLQEFRRVVPREFVESMKNVFLGDKDLGGEFVEELMTAVKTYMVMPVPIDKEPIRRNVDSRNDFERYRPVPIDPGALSAIVYGYFADELTEGSFKQLRGSLMESAVLLHLLYIIGYSNPTTRSRKMPPIVRPPSGADFIAYVTGYAEPTTRYRREIPLVVEVKAKFVTPADLKPGSEFFDYTLKRLALVGYYYAVYPMLVTPYEPPARVVTVKLDPKKAPDGYPKSWEELRAKHEEHRSRYFLGESPYVDSDTRNVVLLSLKAFSLGAPLRFSRAFSAAFDDESAIILRIFVSQWTLGSKSPCSCRFTPG